jgi:surfeit locus 1 family protein
MYRFLRSPRWLAGHALVLVAVITFANLGFWQLGRLAERRDHNELVTSQLDRGEVDIASLRDVEPQQLVYLPVSVTGVYDVEAEVLLSTRSHDGRPGHHVLTPLRTDAGPTVLVDRGWVPLDWNLPPVAQAAPPDGQVRVRGLLHPSSTARRSGAFDGSSGPFQFVSDVDIPVLSEATGTPLFPLYLVAQDQQPAQPDGMPVVAEPPVLTEGSHLTYAVQWFLFAAVVAIGYPILLWHTARQGRRTIPASRSDRAPTPVA